MDLEDVDECGSTGMIDVGVGVGVGESAGLVRGDDESWLSRAGRRVMMRT